MKHSVLSHSRPGTRRRRVVPAAVLTALAVGHIGASAQDLIQNGSFEEPVVGSYAIYTTGQTFGGVWQVEHADGYMDIIGSYGTQPPSVFYPTPAGAQFCYLADSVRYSVLRQDIATPLTAGLTYELSFLQSTFYMNYGYLDGRVTVELAPAGGAPELTRVFSLSDYSDWTEQSLLFAPAVSGPYTLRFSSTPGVPGNIDDVRLVEAAVPEPAACGLAAGLGLLGLAGWRRWRRP
ncbi:MAG: PEP-CTERM sorting domain-containing protein [Verrucomicrobia bacterium]|nr:PEP-CTERM sorting domain-containing protein [Verrucomicrobiota bacterium]